MIVLLLYILFSLVFSISIDSILSTYEVCQDCNIKRSKVETLAFVTPWNQGGYAVATEYWHKFNYISGAWYELHINRTVSNSIYFNISGEVDQGFMFNVTQYGIKSSIFPQFELARSDTANYRAFLSNETMASSLADAIHDRLSLYNFTGCVLNMMRSGAEILKSSMSDYPEYRRLQVIMTNQVAKQLNRRHIKTIVVVPELKQNQMPDFNSEEFLLMFNHVHRFIITANDYSINFPGPNSPLLWVRKNINHAIANTLPFDINLNSHTYDSFKRKIMFSTPLFGYEYHASSESDKKYENRVITGSNFIEILMNKQPKLTWQDSYGELKLEYNENSTQLITYYNTDQSVLDRVQMATRLGTGIMIWELGQGLPFHFQYI